MSLGSPTREPPTPGWSSTTGTPPHPIGLHTVHILAVEGRRVHVRNLEALDATPILDVKPLLTPHR
ncbi:TrmO family methyltransferase [Nonomuraea sp. NPDC005692]|uniref:TrmO family methyltransferase domain-containing protein n=1 Tax=Nonomuraea sp. NPDC005692 TaxID=3157168 RepID=UPI0033DC17D2